MAREKEHRPHGPSSHFFFSSLGDVHEEEWGATQEAGEKKREERQGAARGGSGRGGRLAVARTSRLRHPSVWVSLAPFESKKSCAWTGVMDHERDGEHHDEQRLQHFQFLKVPLLVHRIEFN